MKRTIALITSLVMLLSLLATGMSVSASTNGITSDQAIAWCKDMADRSEPIDVDGNGVWCVDLTKKYAAILGANDYQISGYAYEYAKPYFRDKLPSGWQQLEGVQPQKGDILVYLATAAYANVEPYKWGHVAIYENDNSTYHQCYAGHNYTYHVATASYTNCVSPYQYYWGVIRPDFAAPAPEEPEEPVGPVNDFITDFCFDPQNNSLTPISSYYVKSDETADYYVYPEPVKIIDWNGKDYSWRESETIFFMTRTSSNDSRTKPRIEHLDGSECLYTDYHGWVTVPGPDYQNSISWHYIRNLEPGVKHRLNWTPQESPLLSRNVYLDFVTEGEPVSTELTSSEGTNLFANTYTTLKLKPAPCDRYSYKFIIYNKTTKKWFKLQDFSDTTIYRWNTGPAGEKTIFVDIKDKTTGTVIRRVQLEVNVEYSNLCASFMIDPSGELPAKSHAMLTSTAENGTPPYEYKFIVHNEDNGQWYKLRDFSPANTFDWYTGSAGQKTLYVDVRDASGVVVRMPYHIVVKNNLELKMANFSISGGSKLPEFKRTTLSAVAENGTAPYKYKFVVVNNDTSEAYVIQDYKAKSTCEWYTGPAGHKTLKAYVKDADGNTAGKEIKVVVSAE